MLKEMLEETKSLLSYIFYMNNMVRQVIYLDVKSLGIVRRNSKVCAKGVILIRSLSDFEFQIVALTEGRVLSLMIAQKHNKKIYI